MQLFCILHSLQVLQALERPKANQQTVILMFSMIRLLHNCFSVALKNILSSCSASASDLQSIQDLIGYYRSDLAQALIRHERSLQVALHQIKLIGKDKCASENLQVLPIALFIPISVCVWLQEVTPEMCACLQEEARLQVWS